MFNFMSSYGAARLELSHPGSNSQAVAQYDEPRCLELIALFCIHAAVRQSLAPRALNDGAGLQLGQGGLHLGRRASGPTDS